MIPTPEQVQAMRARGWKWVRWAGRFFPASEALLGAVTVRPVEGGWEGKAGHEASGALPLLDAADWAAAELRRAALRSPIFEGVVEAKWQMAKPKVWMLCIGKFPVVSVLILRSTIQMNVNSNEYIYQSSEALNAEIARRGLPPLPADAWEAE